MPFRPKDTFMKPQVFRDDVLEVETTHGTEILPVNEIGISIPKSPGGDDDATEIAREYSDYLEGTPISARIRRGMWVGRYSAPGYLDATCWSADTNKQRLEKTLRELYNVDY
jgi:hypothetical protein